jgi:Tfp pilus assembly protein FimV
MKNNTNIRLHVSKALFATIAKEVLAEAKVNGGGAYTQAVKMPKQVKEVNAMADTDKMEKMEEKMSSKEKMAKGLYNEVDAEMDTDKMKKMKEAHDFSDAHNYTYRLVDGNCIRINPETQERAKVHHTYCNDLKKEMQVNVAEDDMINEMDPAAVTDLLSVLAGMGGIALGGLGIVKWQDKIKAKNPELYKKLQDISSAISKADPSKDLREKSASLNELMTDREHFEWCKKNNFDHSDCRRKMSFFKNQGWINETKKATPTLNELRKKK